MDDILSAPVEAIERLQSEKLRAMLDLCSRGHPYYRQRWSEAGVDPCSILDLTDLQRLPLTPKKDLLNDPESFRLQLPGLPLHERTLWEVIYTTGSTADPVPLYNTTHDYHAYLFQAKRAAGIAGLNDTDVIANLFPLTPAPMGAFVRSTTNAYAAGAAVCAALPGARLGTFDVYSSLDHAVRLVERHHATVLWGVTSFVRRVLLRALELGADFTRVRMCAVTGEASSIAMKDELRRCMRELSAASAIIFDRYGSTELGAFAQCRENGDWHNPAPEIQYHEVVDADTGRRLPDGERGALAVTYLDRRGTVLIRFLIGDHVSIARGPCPECGRTVERVVGPVVRVSDLVKVKGMLINPAVVLECLQGMPEVDEFQVVIRRQDAADPFSMDEMVVRVAARSTASAPLAETIAAYIQDAVHVRPRVEFTSADRIYQPDCQPKAVRFVDQR